MSLSAHEKTQFELLTAGLELGDPSVLKKMARKDRATAMHYVPLPSRSAVMLFIVLINFCVFAGSVLANNGTAALLTGVLGTLLGALAVRNATFGKSSGRLRTARRGRVATEKDFRSPSVGAFSALKAVAPLPIVLGLASIPVSFVFLLAHNYPAAFGILFGGGLFVAAFAVTHVLTKKNKDII